MRKMERPTPRGGTDGNNDKGFRGASAKLQDLFKGAGRRSGTQGAARRALAARGARIGATNRFPSAGARRGRGRKWIEPRATVAGMGAGGGDRGEFGGGDRGGEVF